jgi:cytochrome c-type biogenesis protein CcmE
MGLPRGSAPMEKSVETARADAEAAVEAAAAAPPISTRRAGAFASPTAKFSLAVAIVAAIILLGLFLPTGAPGPKYTDVRDITAAPAAYDGKTVAVVGGVKPGSVSVGSALAFDLTDYGDESVAIRAVYSGGMDANFGEGKKVLAEGTVQVVGGVPKLVVDKISIGCPTDYRPESPPQ